MNKLFRDKILSGLVLIFFVFLFTIPLRGVVFFSQIHAVTALVVALVIPGYVIARVALRQLSRLEHLVLALPISIVFLAIAITVTFSTLGVSYSEIGAQISTALLGVLLGGLFLLQGKQNTKTPLVNWRAISPFLIVAFLFIAVRILHIALYPYVPEGDSYPLILKIQELQIQNLIISPDISRPFFLRVFEFLSTLSGINPVNLFRFVAPSLLVGVSLLPVLWLRRKQASSLTQVVGGLLTISAPIISLEIDIIRPQTIAILFSATVIYLLALWRETKSWNLYVTAVVLSAFGFYFHELTIFCLFACLIVVIPEYVRALREDYRKTLLWTGGILIALYPYLRPIIGGGIVSIISTSIISLVKHPAFDPWFVDSYTNADGNNLGWPGYLAIVYYGYNFGCAIAIGLIATLLLRVKEFRTNGLVFSSLCFLIAPLLFAEIFPRFGFAFLPDRAWLFLSIGLAFFIIAYLPRFSKRFQYVLLVLCVLSLGLGATITYLKQGWISSSEYRTSQWIKENTPESSLLYVQNASTGPLQVYAGRNTVSGSDIFEKGEFVSWFEMDDLRRSELESDAEVGLQEINYSLKNSPFSEDIAKKINNYKGIYSLIQKNVDKSQEIDSPEKQFIIYSEDKFSGLYGQRPWWRELNDAGVRLEFLNDVSKFKKVFSDGGTTIWEVL